MRDRTAQMATVLVLEPIFEADLPSEQYAYRQQQWLDCGMKARDKVSTPSAISRRKCTALLGIRRVVLGEPILPISPMLEWIACRNGTQL
jgi:hypothetical protein